ncbi:2678_t:CDS:1 [Acaulospora colombiana]|uniref:2678_t:CDS:1 n=1 Tax=Acaulospora colombiana TaxID=27376 RepID=A0ACA9MKF3_9GLOM|nr:2678_t:CDS:1 [Acaulospora colombiana]
MSSIAIHAAFFEALNKTLHSCSTTPQDLLNPLFKIPSDSPMPLVCPPLEQRLDIRPKFSQVLDEAGAHYLVPDFLKKVILGKYWAGDKHARDIPDFRSRIMTFSLMPEEFEELVVLTKKHGSTINSVVHIAMIFSAYRNLWSDESKNDDKERFLRTESPISLRPYATPQIPWSDVGNYVTEFTFEHKLKSSERNFWKLCHIYRSKLLSSVPHAIGHVGMLDYLESDNDAWETYLKDKMNSQNNGRSYSLGLSNIGRFPINQVPSSLLKCDSQEDILKTSDITNNGNGGGGGLKIVDMIFTQAPFTVGTTIRVNCLCFGKKLGLSVVYQKGVVTDDKKIEKFGEGILKCLRILLAKGEIEIDEKDL